MIGSCPAGAAYCGADLAGEARAHVLDDVARVLERAGDFRDALDDGAEVADRDALGEQELQHALDAGRRDLRRHDLLDEVGVLLRQLLEELLHLDMGEQLGACAP